MAHPIIIPRLPARLHDQTGGMFAARIESGHPVGDAQRPVDLAGGQQPFRHRQHLTDDQFGVARPFGGQPVVKGFVDPVEVGEQRRLVGGQPAQHRVGIVARASLKQQGDIVSDMRMVDRDRLAVGMEQRRRGTRPGFQFHQTLAQAGVRLRLGAMAPQQRA